MQCPLSLLSISQFPFPGMPGLARWGSLHTQVPVAHEEPTLHLRNIWVNRAIAIRTEGTGWAPHGFVQEPVYEAGRERACCSPVFCAEMLGGPEVHAAPLPTASGHTHCIFAWGLGRCDSGRGGFAGAQGPGAAQGPEVTWDLLFYPRHSHFNCWLDLGTAPLHDFV